MAQENRKAGMPCGFDDREAFMKSMTSAQRLEIANKNTEAK